MKLTKKHIAFVNALFSNGFNQTKAYMEAYQCSWETAHGNIGKVMAYDCVKELIAERQAEQKERANISKEAILDKLIEIAHDPTSKKQDALKAFEMINKMIGYNNETTNVQINIEQRLFSDDDLKE